MLLQFFVAWPRWLFMWLLATSIYFVCKLLTLSGEKTEQAPRLRLLAYLFAWPGMNPARFLAVNSSRSPARPDGIEWGFGLLNLVAGAVVFWNAHYFVTPASTLLLGWAGMIGTILMLHFGSFHLISCFWRRLNVDAPPLMNQPMRSTSVAEFWTRWNTAFRDLTYRFLFRPFRFSLGSTIALVLGFFVSGLIHDLVISVPAGGGYGGPTSFFCIQAGGVLVERTSIGRSLGFGRGWRGWLFTGLVLLLPLRLLFHDIFVTRVVVPFMQALGAA